MQNFTKGVKNELYLCNFWGSVKELLRIGIRNDWVVKKDLLRLIEAEYEDKNEKSKFLSKIKTRK